MLFILITSAFYLPEAMLLYSGYCREEKRYLSDQEKFDEVVTELIGRRVSVLPYTVNEFGGKSYAKTGFVDASLRYSSLEEFYALNPGCCELVEFYRSSDGIVSIPCSKRASGEINALVRIFYIYDFDAQNSKQPLYREDYFIVSNCGKVWRVFDDKAPYLINGF